MTKQIELLTVTGTITTAGNAALSVIADGLAGSPVSVSFSVDSADDATTIAQNARYALAIDSNVSAFFLVGGSGVNVQLTARVDADNDTTMSVSIDNGTCAGITPSASTTTQNGAAIVSHGYCTVDDFKKYARIDTLNTTDDETIIALIESASRYIDDKVATQFYSSTGDKKFDTPKGTQLLFFARATQINTITNGDGSDVPASYYITLPYNGAWISGVELITGQWRDAPNTDKQCITINADWGEYSITPPQIREACLLITKAAYNRRFGENMTTTSTVTVAGVVITPEDVPAKALDIISNKRYVVV